MSEYWVSKKKYYCKYCEIYIADDAPSRQQHENGLRHKGNVERFIKGLYKAGEKRKKDLEEEKREMARVELAAQAAFAQDIGAGHAKASSSSTPGPSHSASAAKKPQPKPSNPYANYSTAESLGYTDPDAERLKAEAERRRTMGVAGEWEVISVEQPAPSDSTQDSASATEGALPDAEESRKRPATIEDEEDGRQFKVRKKTWGAGIGGIYDPGIIPIKLKAKKEEVLDPGNGEGDAGPSIAEVKVEEPKPTGLPKWTKIEWKKVADEPTVVQEQESPDPTQSSHQTVKEPDAIPPQSPIKEEETKPLLDNTLSTANEETTGLFRKRKIGAGNRGRRQL